MHELLSGYVQIHEYDMQIHALLIYCFLILALSSQAHWHVQTLQAAVVSHPYSQNPSGNQQELEVCQPSKRIPDKANRWVQLRSNYDSSVLVPSPQLAAIVRILH